MAKPHHDDAPLDNTIRSNRLSSPTDPAGGLNIPAERPLDASVSTRGKEPTLADPPSGNQAPRAIPSGADPQSFVHSTRTARDDPHRSDAPVDGDRLRSKHK